MFFLKVDTILFLEANDCCGKHQTISIAKKIISVSVKIMSKHSTNILVGL